MGVHVMLLIKIVFNVFYLAAIWMLVLLMYKRKNIVGYKEKFTIQSILFAFLVLAFGETLCGIFKVMTYIFGSTNYSNIAARNGTIISGVTVTLFITLLLLAFKYHFSKRIDFFQVVLLFFATLRLITIVFPDEKLKFSGDVLFVALGLGVVFLILKEAFERYDTNFTQIGIMLLISILCYIPILFFVSGDKSTFLLMIPKAIANLVIGMVSLNGLFRKSGINVVKLRG